MADRLGERFQKLALGISRQPLLGFVGDFSHLLDDPDDDRPVAASATIGIMQRVHLHDISGIILKNPALGYEILLIEMRYKGAYHKARQLDTWPGSSIGYVDHRTEIGDLADPVRFPEAGVARLEAQMMIDGTYPIVSSPMHLNFDAIGYGIIDTYAMLSARPSPKVL